MSAIYCTLRFLTIILTTACTCQSALPQVTGPPIPERQPAIQHRVFTSTSGEPTVHMVIFDSSRYTMRVVDNGTRMDRPAYSNLAEAMRQNHCLAGINGGFFDTSTFAPNGLMITEGQTISSFDAKGWQEGVLTVRGTHIDLIERDAFTTQPRVTHGLQSSPWLIRSGRVEELQQGDTRRARRAFAATGKSGLCAIGFSTPATFSELAQILASSAVSENIAISQALALDGATSAGFWCNLDGRQVSDPELTTVRNFVGIIPLSEATPKPSSGGVFWAATALFSLIAVVIVFWLRRHYSSNRARSASLAPRRGKV